ncbi:endoglucanase 15-like [Hordeum vulgare]|nr:endoglucanase 15-like [Hordeum vulgare]
MAAASMVFRTTYPCYANLLLEHSKQLFEFVDNYRGKYDASIIVARNYYGSFSGYGDELLWAAAWLFEAMEERFYLEYMTHNGDALGGTSLYFRNFCYIFVQGIVASSGVDTASQHQLAADHQFCKNHNS